MTPRTRRPRAARRVRPRAPISPSAGIRPCRTTRSATDHTPFEPYAAIKHRWPWPRGVPQKPAPRQRHRGGAPSRETRHAPLSSHACATRDVRASGQVPPGLTTRGETVSRGPRGVGLARGTKHAPRARRTRRPRRPQGSFAPTSGGSTARARRASRWRRSPCPWCTAPRPARARAATPSTC